MQWQALRYGCNRNSNTSETFSSFEITETWCLYPC